MRHHTAAAAMPAVKPSKSLASERDTVRKTSDGQQKASCLLHRTYFTMRAFSIDQEAQGNASAEQQYLRSKAADNKKKA
jgi:hypothetical protein